MKYKILTVLVVMFSLTSCKKYLDVNTNPNKPQTVPAKVLLPAATVATAYANGVSLGMCTSLWMQYNAGFSAQQRTYDTYRINFPSFNLEWSFVYQTAVSNLRIIIQDNEEKSPVYSGIAKIQLAYVISMATDVWGDVPYSQAGFGEVYTQPRFDKQEDIYQGNAALGITSLFDLVKSGLNDLEKPSIFKPATDDLIYSGDINKWKKAGNSLILKLANTISGVNPQLAKQQINDVLSSSYGYIQALNENWQVPFSATTNNTNPIYAIDKSGIYKDGQMLSSSFLALSNSLNDNVRLAKFYTKPNGIFTSYANGNDAAAPAAASRSLYNTYVIGTAGEAPHRLMTNFQMKFILAESVLMLGVAGDANQLYQDGIKASMEACGMTATEISTYFTANPQLVTLAGTQEEMLQQIITQKYIAWVGNGIEAYNDYRRTGYPALTPAQNAQGDNDGKIPLRILYTPNEIARNPNVPNPLPTTAQKVWWAK